MTTTAANIRDQVLATLAGDYEIYDVKGIVRELVEGKHRVDATIGSSYWGIVAKYQHPDA